MPEWAGAALGLALLGVVGFLLWAERRYPGAHRPRPRRELQAVCARCVWREGEDCTHPESPARGGPVGEVCAGRVRCKVREIRVSGRE